MVRNFILSVLLLAGLGAVHAQQTKGPQVGDLRTLDNMTVHDPVMVRQGNTYYLFSTGQGISVWSSPDLQTWKKEAPVFASAPEWATQAVAGFKDNHIWAPDISFHKGNYYLYYSISAFGKNTSAIGLATNTTLNPQDKNFKWVDHGKVIVSVPGQTNWNAIDPNLFLDEKGTPWLAFGSFWGGLKLVKMHQNRLRVAQDLSEIPTIASRRKNVTQGANAIEAPFVFRKNGYYYLFASIDYCCKGAKSDYKMIVGRSKNAQGPYVDKNGLALEAGGGTMLLEGNEKWHGVGHNAVYTFDNIDYLVFHGYDATQNGRAKLRIEKLTWDPEQWPVVAVAQ
ncbi:arabinan endo-1,5-alpha-L-arabinosidase [Rufibacter glacialis]|uniref:Arabinan endo-1,5-alpha-L-arabinosidase n=1 Tax=Rufibacter glacialis TaxID=1259555 RepID=A0A5M8QPI9_9BACT|nr:arabinan endo-1,5-alpha-L-arabinosidase [Rufibacter glacialis]KAA6437161.1 arabinan endo-1,5-alpha-L-arabinosidase [Rufibacter glacialis]GGK61663.1 extracellular endo-alpha-(1->5)-L-arabinanase 1 [Rufibacter glacialis]